MQGDPAMTPEAMQAWVDQMTAHAADPNRPPDCACWDCRIMAALDHPTLKAERDAIHRAMSMERLWNRRRFVERR